MAEKKIFHFEVPAKINIGLFVEKQREDGYHSIMSVFHLISLYDEIDMVVSLSEETECRVVGLEHLKMGKIDTMTDAVEKWSEETGIKVSVDINIKKNIPDQSGLGGGSSDAAGVLLKLEEWAGFPSCSSSLYKTALSVGADVPFFVSKLSAAFVQGIGEIIKPIRSYHGTMGMVLIPSGRKVSTRKAYKIIDEKLENNQPSCENFLQQYNAGIDHCLTKNDFECINREPGFKDKKSSLIWLSGSGSAWFYRNDCVSPDFRGKIFKVTLI